MATDNPAATESELDDFDALMLRLESTIFRLKLVAEAFGDLAIQPVTSTEEHGPAAYVVREAADDLIRVYQGLTTLHRHTPFPHPKASPMPSQREHTPKAVQNQDVPQAPPSSR